MEARSNLRERGPAVGQNGHFAATTFMTDSTHGIHGKHRGRLYRGMARGPAIEALAPAVALRADKDTKPSRFHCSSFFFCVHGTGIGVVLVLALE